jgi:GNAT superfamily N-acetyltransferase
MNRTLAMAGPREASPPGCAIRAGGPEDTEAIREFVSGLSVGTQYFRFFTAVSPPSPSLLRALAGATGKSDILLVTDGCGAVIGHGMTVDAAVDGEVTADVGLVIADRWQGQGLGRALLGRLARRAAGRGVTTLTLEVLPDNARMLGMINRRWPGASRKRTSDAIVIRADLTLDLAQPAGSGREGRDEPARSAA